MAEKEIFDVVGERCMARVLDIQNQIADLRDLHENITSALNAHDYDELARLGVISACLAKQCDEFMNSLTYPDRRPGEG